MVHRGLRSSRVGEQKETWSQEAHISCVVIQSDSSHWMWSQRSSGCLLVLRQIHGCSQPYALGV